MQEEVIRHLPVLKVVGAQIEGTAQQIEQAVVNVCSNFQQIAEQARSGVNRATAFLANQNSDGVRRATVEELIEQSRATFDSLLSTLARSAEISQQAVRHMQEIDGQAEKITGELKMLQGIADGNHILALNARIEAARAGELGKGFEVVATEVVSQSTRSHGVISDVSQTIQQLRASAASALTDLNQMTEKGLASAEVERNQVDQTLQSFTELDHEMRSMLEEASRDNARLSTEIGKAVNGMQFQDRVNQRLQHVVEALDASRVKLSGLCGAASEDQSAVDDILQQYTMHEERSAANRQQAEAAAGEVELF